MASHTAAFDAAHPGTRTRGFRSSRETIAHVASLTIGLVSMAYSARLAGRSLLGFALLGAAILFSTLFAHKYSPVHGTPLDIDRTRRLVRSLLVGLVLVLISAALAPKIGIVAIKSYLVFVLLLAISRACLRFRSGTNVFPAAEYLETLPDRRHALLKRTIDVAVAAVALIILAPFLLIIALAVKIDSAGPVFFSHQRVGRRGRLFRILKFRSMHVHAAKYQRSPSNTNDVRITRVGRVIRRLSLDEIPQLLNVLRGEMSLVGPRPEMPFVVSEYTAFQRKRLNALPGITGLWQISPARALPIHHNIEYDLYYVARQSLMLDLAILCRTAGSVVRGIGAA